METATRLQQLKAAEQNALGKLLNEFAQVGNWRQQRRWIWIATLTVGVVLGRAVSLLNGT